MGSVGDAYDNAMAESFFATLECELLARRPGSKRRPRHATPSSSFIEGFYNPRRRHSSLEYLSPVEFERRHREAATSPGALELAAALGAVKVKPSRARKVRDLDRSCARRLVECAGRDGRMDSAGAEQKDGKRKRRRRMPCRQVL